MSYLPYISDENLKSAVRDVVDSILETQQKEEATIYRNVIDPFSAIFDSVVLQFSFEDWLKKERARQIQKTVQNRIGEFHQTILGSIQDWENLGTGNIVDIRNKSRKIIAEIKNKYNTVKGNHRHVIYDDLLSALKQPEHQGFTAYYVEIIPKGKQSYDRPFTPPHQGGRKTTNVDIRQISGQTFYDLVTGQQGAISMLFDILPDVISNLVDVNKFTKKQKEDFRNLFDRAY